jgi:hypothetical protein
LRQVGSSNIFFAIFSKKKFDVLVWQRKHSDKGCYEALGITAALTHVKKQTFVLVKNLNFSTVIRRVCEKKIAQNDGQHIFLSNSNRGKK